MYILYQNKKPDLMRLMLSMKQKHRKQNKFIKRIILFEWILTVDAQSVALPVYGSLPLCLRPPVLKKVRLWRCSYVELGCWIEQMLNVLKTQLFVTGKAGIGNRCSVHGNWKSLFSSRFPRSLLAFLPTIRFLMWLLKLSYLVGLFACKQSSKLFANPVDKMHVIR